MFELVKAIHILALMFGAAASFGNLYVMMAKGAHDLPSPGFTNQLRFLFRITGLTAIIAIWATGLILMFTRYGWWVQSFTFDAKIVFAGLLLAIITFLNLINMGKPVGPGGPPSYVGILHIVGAICLVLAAMFAVLAFGG